jgi:hypothetical protein
MIYKLGCRAKIGKIYISQAVRLLIIHPSDFDLLGIYFEGYYYIDKCLPMGCAISCSLFKKFSPFIHWMVEQKSGLKTVDHYLDDFIFAGAPSSNDCFYIDGNLFSVSRELCIPIEEKKTVGPTTGLDFLGFTIDTLHMMVKIAQDKLVRLRISLLDVLTKKKITLSNLESVTGLMLFCSKAIPSARAFIRRFYDLIASVNNIKPHYFVRINKEVRKDVQVWLDVWSISMVIVSSLIIVDLLIILWSYTLIVLEIPS